MIINTIIIGLDKIMIKNNHSQYKKTTKLMIIPTVLQYVSLIGTITP